MTQKKVQLLENAVFELRGLVGAGVGSAANSNGPASASSASTASPLPVGGAVYSDLSDDDWESDVPAKGLADTNVAATAAAAAATAAASVSDDLQPGGTLNIPPEAMQFADESPSDRFRALFSQKEESSSAPVAVSSAPVASVPVASVPAQSNIRSADSLENMPVRDLRRLAEQRGVTGAADMKKKEILAALRAQIVQPASDAFGAAGSSDSAAGLSELSGHDVGMAETENGTASVIVEKTLDLDTIEPLA